MFSSGLQGHYRKFQPNFAVSVESSAGTFTSVAVADGWVDLNFPDVSMFGLKWAWSQSGAVYSYDLFYRMHVSFRTVR